MADGGDAAAADRAARAGTRVLPLPRRGGPARARNQGAGAARVQNFRNWSQEMVPDGRRCAIGVECFCGAGDALWTRPDEYLLAMAAGEIEAMGLARRKDVADGIAIRQPHAYPVYGLGCREAPASVRHHLAGIRNLRTVGRSGLHRYNNQDHSMLTALRTVENLGGANHALHLVNEDPVYLEAPPR